MKVELKKLINTVKKEYFTSDYQTKVNDQQVLGIILSQYFEWDGSQIFEVCSYGLEDSNFHKENKELTKVWNSLK